MKKSPLIYIALTLLCSMSSCDKYLDVNTNPNAPITGKPEQVLAGAIIETARIQARDIPAFANYWAGYWAASGSYSQSNDVVRTYNLNFTSFQGTWDDLYLNINNYNSVEVAAKQLKFYDYYIAVAKIMKSLNAHTLVDIYGDVPYSDAIKGFSSLRPKYDNAKDIYQNLAVQLDSAVIIIKNAKTPQPLDPGADPMFGGDTKKWIKFANTLKLRILVHQSQVAGLDGYIKTEVAKIVANGGGFLGASEDARINPGYTKANDKQSPFWESNGQGVDGSTGSRDYNRPSAYALKFFQTPNDPRIDYLFRSPGDDPGTNSATTYKAIPFGALPTTDLGSTQTSGMGIGVLSGPGQDFVLFTAAESYFLQAEAAQRGYLTGNAKTFYQSGITESFKLLVVDDAVNAAATYYALNVNDISWDASADKIEAIITQKWAALTFINGLEAWTDYRRLGIPKDVPLSVDPNRIGGGKAPVRLLYPQTEYNYNSTEVSAKGTISQFDTRIFWDVN